MIEMTSGARWLIGRDGNSEFHVRDSGRDHVKMRVLNKDGSFWLECHEMGMYDDDGAESVHLGTGLCGLNAPTLKRAQAAAERIYEGWVEEQIMHYSRFLEQIFGKTVWC